MDKQSKARIKKSSNDYWKNNERNKIKTYDAGLKGQFCNYNKQDNQQENKNGMRII